MSNDISLTGSQRLALIDLRDNAFLSSRTQRRLSSGRKINSVIDDSVNYFKAKALKDTANDFDNLRAEMAQAIKHLEVTLEAISSLERILGQMKGILEASRSQSSPERALATTAIRRLGDQFRELVIDANYGGANLINNTTGGRTVKLGLRSSSRISLPGLNLVNGGNLAVRTWSIGAVYGANGSFRFSVVFTAASLSRIGAANSNVAMVDGAVAQVDGAISRLRGHAQALGSNVAILQEREKFTDKFVTLSTVGSEQYTLADLNEEGANLVALQTRQQLGIQALAVAGQQQRAILTLLQ